MRAPFQILAIPYKIIDNLPVYCVFYRADFDQWQFISGGGEDDETPLQAAIREIYEEGGINVDNILELKSMCYIPTDIFPKSICIIGQKILMLCRNILSDFIVRKILSCPMNMLSVFGLSMKKLARNLNGTQIEPLSMSSIVD